MELSFVDEHQVMEISEGLIKAIFKNVLDVDFPEPFPSMTWAEAMDRFGIDRPDLRFGLELKNVSDIVANADFKVFASSYNFV